MKKFIALYRVSTKAQEESELGLKSQREAVRSYVKSQGGVIIQEFTEIISGANKDVIKHNMNVNLESLLRKRPILQQCLALALSEGATIAVKEVSRLTRYKLLGEYLMATNVDFIAADSPNDSKLILSIKIALFQEEAENISKRTSAALQRKIAEDGAWQKPSEAYKSGMVASLAREKKSLYALQNQNNRRAAALICSLRKDGLTFQEMATYLNENDFKTSRGNRFNPIQVQRLFNGFCNKQGKLKAVA